MTVEGAGGLKSRHSLIVRPVHHRSCKCSNRQFSARVGSPPGRDLKQVINYSYSYHAPQSDARCKLFEAPSRTGAPALDAKEDAWSPGGDAQVKDPTEGAL